MKRADLLPLHEGPGADELRKGPFAEWLYADSSAEAQLAFYYEADEADPQRQSLICYYKAQQVEGSVEIRFNLSTGQIYIDSTASPSTGLTVATPLLKELNLLLDYQLAQVPKLKSYFGKGADSISDNFVFVGRVDQVTVADIYC